MVNPWRSWSSGSVMKCLEVSSTLEHRREALRSKWIAWCKNLLLWAMPPAFQDLDRFGSLFQTFPDYMDSIWLHTLEKMAAKSHRSQTRHIDSSHLWANLELRIKRVSLRSRKTPWMPDWHVLGTLTLRTVRLCLVASRLLMPGHELPWWRLVPQIRDTFARASI